MFDYILICSKYELHMILIHSLYISSYLHLYNVLICLQYPFEDFEVILLFHKVVTNFGHICN